jgi:hypothetical protein
MTLHGTLDPGVFQYRSTSKTVETALFGEIPIKDYRHEWTINGMTPRDSLAATGLVREAAVHLDLGPDGFLEISGGKERVRIGDGWIYDDWGFSTMIRAHLSRLGAPRLSPWVGVVFPYRNWNELESVGHRLMTLTAGLEWRPTPFDGLTIEVAWFRDRARQLGALLANVLAADSVAKGHKLQAMELYGAEPRIESDLLWIRLSGEVMLWRILVTGTVLFQYGKAYHDPLNPAQHDRNIEMPAFAGGLDATLSLDGGHWILGAFMVGVQGLQGSIDVKGTSLTLPIFVSLVPYLPHTALLFSGGLDAALASRQATLLGLDGRGIIASGANLAWRPRDQVEVRLVVAPAWSVGRSPWTSHRFVGVETDLCARMDLGAGFSLELENDIIAGGRYYEGHPLVWRLLGGFSWRYE